MSDEPRDIALDRLYRAGATEQPPQRLDRAVLDFARREASVRPGPTARTWFPLAWRVPVASAAAVVLSLSLMLILRDEPSTLDPLARAPTEHDLPSHRTMAERAPPPVPSAGPVEPPAPAEVRRAPSPDRSDRDHPPAPMGPAAGDGQPSQHAAPGAPSVATRTPEKNVAASSPGEPMVLAAPPVPAASAPAAATPAPQVVTAERQTGARSGNVSPPTAEPPTVAESRGRDSAASDAVRSRDPAMGSSRTEASPATGAAQPQRRSAPSPAPAEGAGVAADPAPAASQAPRNLPASPTDRELSAEQWIARIEQMRAQGRYDDAATSLQAFRKRFPDYPIPAHLR